MALGPLFASSERVDGPVAAVEARGADVFRQCHGCQPLGDRPTLRAGINQAVGQHHEDGVRELEPAPFGVGAKGLDDAVELAGGSQLAHLAEARQRAVGVLAVLPHGLDEREVLIGLVAPPPDRLLYKDTQVLQHRNSAVWHPSPLHSTTRIPTSPQHALVRAVRSLNLEWYPPKSGRAVGETLSLHADASLPDVQTFAGAAPSALVRVDRGSQAPAHLATVKDSFAEVEPLKFVLPS
jgi:hypothetical protein